MIAIVRQCQSSPRRRQHRGQGRQDNGHNFDRQSDGSRSENLNWHNMCGLSNHVRVVKST